MPRKGTGNDRRLKYGDGWIEPRANRAGEPRFLARWEVVAPDGTRERRSKQFLTEADAEAFLRETADAISNGTYVAPEKMTVCELVAAYLERGAYEWKPSTLATYRQRAKAIIEPYLGTVRAVDLKAPRVQHWVDQLVKAKLAANTIDGAVRVLNGTYDDAVRLGIVTVNPVTGTRRPSLRQAPVEVWSADEEKRVLASVGDDPMWEAAYRLALATGVRPGELRVVRWSDLDLEKRVLTVRRSMTKDVDGHQVIGATTKTGRSRAIAFGEKTARALAVWRKEQVRIRLAAERWDDGDLVFSTAFGKLVAQNHWQDRHAKVIADASVKAITLHGMRHTFATRMLERGVHPKIVSEMLGHANIQTTLDLYSHVSPDLQRMAADALDAALDEGEEKDEQDDSDATTSAR